MPRNSAALNQSGAPPSGPLPVGPPCKAPAPARSAPPPPCPPSHPPAIVTASSSSSSSCKLAARLASRAASLCSRSAADGLPLFFGLATCATCPPCLRAVPSAVARMPVRAGFLALAAITSRTWWGGGGWGVGAWAWVGVRGAQPASPGRCRADAMQKAGALHVRRARAPRTGRGKGAALEHAPDRAPDSAAPPGGSPS
jgi:hypothetical protein